jgi:DNA-binding PadR family transcriptional regulator
MAFRFKRAVNLAGRFCYQVAMSLETDLFYTNFHMRWCNIFFLSSREVLVELTLKERRKSVFAAVLRYSPEAGSLRHKVIDRLCLVALFQRTEPLAANELTPEVSIAKTRIRTEQITEALARLARKGHVETTKQMKKKKGKEKAVQLFSISDAGKAQVEGLITDTEKMFEPAVNRMLTNSNLSLPADQARVVCVRFISECFSQYGLQISQAVIGVGVNNIALGEMVNVSSSMRKATKGLHVTTHDRESLEARALRFIKSKEPVDEELKFRLTQGFYLENLLGLDSSQFNPIVENAFEGAVFYLDTNVLLTPLDFDELVNCARTLGIELRVTKATLIELNKVTVDRENDIQAVLDILPKSLIERTDTNILSNFLRERDQQANLTLKMFLDQYNRMEDFLSDLGVVVEDIDDEGLLEKQPNALEVCNIIIESAVEIRGAGKSESIAAHDAFHYFVVSEQRVKNPKCWFLTRDRTLTNAAEKLDGGEGSPFCYPLVGLLHGMSPFLENTNQHCIFKSFTETLDNNVGVASSTNVFSLAELKLIAELHQDVLISPEEDILAAFDFIKAEVLGGQPYTPTRHNEVSLELKKFISSTKDENAAKLRAALAQKDLESKAMNGKLDSVTQQLEQLFLISAEHEATIQALSSDRDIANSENRLLRSAIYFASMAMVYSCYLFAKDISIVLEPHLGATRPLVWNALGSLSLVLFTLWYTKPMSKTIKWVVNGLVFVLALGGLEILPWEELNKLWGPLTLVLAIVAIFLNERISSDSDS